MNFPRTSRPLPVLLAAFLAGLASVQPLWADELTLLNAFTFGDGAAQGGVEILSYTKDQFTVAGIYVGDVDGSGPAATTYGVQVLNLGASGSLTQRHNISFTAANTGLSALSGVSSTALDPLGRGFGVASLIPADNTGTLGRLAFYNYSTGAVIGTISAGYHPDSVSFSADGSKIYVANEGEFKAGAPQAPGSISIIDVSGITSGNLGALTSLSASTFDFSAANLGTSASLSGIRNSNVAGVGTSGAFINSVPDFTNPANQDAGAIEPEYLTVQGGKIYATLQDNNAIGVFDMNTNKWEKINNLGTITQTVDASDQDGSSLVNDTVKGLPMPDTVGSFVKDGKTYLVTANEGDARVDDRDISRFGDTSGNDSMTGLLDTDYPTTATGLRANSELGRLNVSRIDGDTDGDGKIDELTMIGTRSFSVWEVQADNSLLRVYDSGSLETTLLLEDPAAHNINRGDTSASGFDTRSDDKGPEPEGLSVFEMGEFTYMVVALERQNGLLLYDISDPLSPMLLDYINTYTGGALDKLVSPEGLFFISAADSPSGAAMLLVGYEGHDGGAGGTIIEGGIGVYSVVPEPTAGALVALGSAALLAARRRRN